MATPDTLPALLPVTVDGIPASMLDTPRWAPWRAVWNAKKEKYEKIPHRADRVQSGLSNKSSKGWCAFHVAMAAYLKNPDLFAGVGYLMTGAHDLVAVDLDHCVQDGEIAPWAAEVVAKLDSYTEVSPSGRGLRVMIEGTIERDWTNHDVGIEVYGGGDARFVTITGARLPGSPGTVRRPRGGAMDAITARYRKTKTAAEIEDLHLPALLGADELPDISELEIPPHARNFLMDGAEPGRDRSQALFATSIALRQSGLERQVILSILEANEHAMEVAMDHRRQDYDKAVRYLWKDHCQAGVARADGLRQLSMDEFDELEAQEGPAKASPVAAGQNGVADDFDVLDDDFADLLGVGPKVDRAPVKLPRFTPLPLTSFMHRKPARWIVRGVLPQAGLVLLYGDSGAGKTFFALDLVGAVARGIAWRGHTVSKGRVVYIVAEGATGFRNRVLAYCEFNGIEPADLDILVIPDAPQLLDKAHIKELVLAIKKVGPVAIVVVDTYARAMAGANENDAKDTGQAVAHCDLIHRTTGALVLLVHHSGKDGSRGARGSGALRAAADAEIEVLQLRDYRAATVTKMKDGEDGKEYAFKLNEVTIGLDDEGEAITSCVVEVRASGAPAKAMEKVRLTPVQQLVLRAFDTAADLGGQGMHYADIKQAVVDQIPRDLEKKKDNRHRDVGNAIEALVGYGYLNSIEGGMLVRAENNV